MLNGRANDVKRHQWFSGLDWDALAARKMDTPRKPKDDSAKRLKELQVPLSVWQKSTTIPDLYPIQILSCLPSSAGYREAVQKGTKGDA